MALSHIPSTEHFAILTEVSVYIPGDERSQSHPGHGYPASTETYLSYEAFTDRALWEEKVQLLHARGTRFRAMKVQPAHMASSLHIQV